MNKRREAAQNAIASGIVTFVGGFVVLGLLTILGHSGSNATEIRFRAPENLPPISESQRVIEGLVAEGKTCSSEPQMTNIVVLQEADGTAGVVSFDEALERSGDGSIVTAYCS